MEIQQNCPRNKINMGVANNVAELNSYILENIVKKKANKTAVPELHHKRQQSDFLSLVKNITKDSDNQAYLSYNEENLTTFTVILKPNGGLYSGHSFNFKIHMPAKYPAVPPHITCMQHIYHPNIDDEGEICLSLLDDWCGDTNDLRDCVIGLLFLFHHPNIDDPLSPYFDPYELSEKEFHENVEKSLVGKAVDGVVFKL